MTDKPKSITKAALKSLEYHITFLKKIKEDIRQGDAAMQIKSIFAAHCIHEYMQEHLMKDVEEKMKKTRSTNNEGNENTSSDSNSSEFSRL